MISLPWWWWLILCTLLPLGIAYGGSRFLYARWRRRDWHEIRLRVVDWNGFEWMNVSCKELEVIAKCGGINPPEEWYTLETLPASGAAKLQVCLSERPKS